MAGVFQRQIESILDKHGRLEEFRNASGDEGFHMKLLNKPYMPLVIERHAEEVSVNHFYLQNGDVMYDPDVTLDFSTWEPTSLQQAYGYRRERYRYNDKGERIQEEYGFLSSVSSFLVMWGKNLKSQKWIENSIEERSDEE